MMPTASRRALGLPAEPITSRLNSCSPATVVNTVSGASSLTGVNADGAVMQGRFTAAERALQHAIVGQPGVLRPGVREPSQASESQSSSFSSVV